MACSFPSPRFLATEYCHHFVPDGIPVVHLEPTASGWDQFRSEVSGMRDAKEPGTYVVDTVSNLFDTCIQWVCKKMKIEHPSESPYQAYDKIKAEFSRTMRKMHHYAFAGDHIILNICHSKERETPTKGGVVVDVQVNLTNTCKDALLPMCQYAWYIRPGGPKKRELIIDMDSGGVFAKCQDTNVKVSKVVNVPQEGQYEYILGKIY